MREARDVGYVTNGRLVLSHRETFVQDLKALEGERVTFHVYCGMSRKARGYYRAEVLPKIAKKIPLDKDMTHDILKLKFNPITVSAVNQKTGEDESYVVGGSFEDAGRAAFSKILDAIIWWGRDWLGAAIEEPTTVQLQEMFANKGE